MAPTPPITPQIHTTPRCAELLGLSTAHDPAKTFGQEVMGLIGRLWPAIRGAAVPNPGLNWVVYDQGRVFAGVEAAIPDPAKIGLEARPIRLARYASWTHTGPYHLLGQTCAELNRILKSQGHQPIWPTIEIYNHPDPDESKTQTDILIALR